MVQNTIKAADNGRNNIIEHGSVFIRNNAMHFKQNVIQISTINHAWVGLVKKRLPWPAYLLAGMICVIFLYLSLIVALLAAILTLVLYYLFMPQVYGLNMQMSSSYVYAITSTDQDFLHEILGSVSDVIANGGGDLTINLDNRTIMDNHSVANYGIMSYGDNASNTVNME